MKKKTIWITLGLIIILIAAFALSGTIMSQVDEPEYKVLESSGDIEIRQYEPTLVAQVLVEGERKDAISKGFRVLADFIFGNNKDDKEIAMTAPVTQQEGKKIAMTAPVTQQKEMDQYWRVRFVMPAEYTLETLPKPVDEKVEILSVPGQKFAVIRFSGSSTEDNLQTHLKELQAYLAQNKLEGIGDPIYAFYNPPWTLPFMRRNEIMIELPGV